MFFIDKYIPKEIKDSSFHKELLNIIDIMTKDESIPHLIFHGPNGSGKKTLIRLLLQKLYDKDINNTTINMYSVIGSGNKINTIPIKQSNYHIVIEPNNNNFDKHLIQDVVKDFARKVQLNIFKSNRTFKTVLINGIDNMSYYAQTSLRRTMEKYSKTCRFIMWCHSLSKVIDPLKSRCMCISVPSPNESEIFAYIFKINIAEKMNLTYTDLCDISKNAKGNIKNALWIMQNIKINKNAKSIKDNCITDYDISLDNIINIILDCDLSKIIDIRNIIYNIMITNINGSKIISDIMAKLLEKKLSESTKCKIILLASKFDHNIVRGRREIIHIEGFIIGIIEILNNDNAKKYKSNNS